MFLSIELRVERRMGKKNQADSEMLKGTLDMMILRTLMGGDAHGHTIAKVIERTSEDVLEVEQGSLYPALHRLEDRRWVSSYWGASENNPRTPPTGRYLHDASQVLVGAIHKQSMQVDLGRFGAELAALQDETVYVQISYPRKICVVVTSAIKSRPLIGVAIFARNADS